MFANLLIILVASLITIALFRRLNLPPLLGYLCVGVLCGPFAAGWISAGGQDMSILAEMGVVFLLFTLGLEFSLPRMLALKSTVLAWAACKSSVPACHWRRCCISTACQWPCR